MRKSSKNFICALLTTTFLANMSALALVDITYENSYKIGQNTTYTNQVGTNSNGPQNINIIEYGPNSNVTPVVVYGNKLYGKSNITTAKKYLEELGYNVIGGINGDYYVTSTGIPIGLVMRDGRIVSSDAWQQAVGFKSDGTAIIGRPAMNMRLYKADGTYIQVDYMNKSRSTAGVYLYNDDFSAETRISTSGTNIILERLDGNEITPSSELSFKVVGINKTSSSQKLYTNQMILTFDDKITSDKLPDISSMQIGDTVKLTTNVNDKVWSQVQYAVGAKEVLLSGGIVQSGLSSSVNPRSAVGVKADGTVVIYEVDGRLSSHSRGLTLTEVAEELKRLGCVSAVNLDGGGSSSFIAKFPGYSDAVVTNTPSEGSLRSNANYIMFVNNTSKTGMLNEIHMYPESNLMLLNSEVSVDVKGVDENYYPVDIGSSYTLTSPDSSVEILSTNKFKAKNFGNITVTANYNGFSDTKSFTVLDNIDSIFVKKQSDNQTVTSISLEPNRSIDLTATASYKYQSVASSDESFKWTVNGNIGTIDEFGVFTAGNNKADGSITVSYGNNASSTISVSVGMSEQDNILLVNDFEKSKLFEYVGATLSLNSDLENVFIGKQSLQTSYDFSQNNISELYLDVDTSDYKYLNMSIKGDGSLNSIIANFIDENDSKLTKNVVSSLHTNGNFNVVSIEIPENAVKFTGFSIVNNGTVKGAFYIDHITMSHSEYNSNAPVVDISSPTSSQSVKISGTIIDDFKYAVKKENIQMYFNGSKVDFTYTTSSGAFTTNTLSLVNGTNRLTVVAKDNFSNTTYQSIDVNYGASSTKYQDISSHWAKNYINFADYKGIVTGEVKDGQYYFNPTRNITRAEFAVIISRYLGLDTSNQTPNSNFADLSSIPSWALPHVIAVSNAGIMKGSLNNDKLYFNPTNNIVRAEVVTVLGRTVEKGFKVSSLNFKDNSQIPTWSSEYFILLSSLGVINGYEDNTIRPNNFITRAEVCKMIYTMH